jgi:hypothetical protein
MQVECDSGTLLLSANDGARSAAMMKRDAGNGSEVVRGRARSTC